MKLGIESVLEHSHIFKGKRIGLITNHTGLTQNFESSIDIFKKNFDLRCLFSPEHGVRGDVQAGEKVSSYIDQKSNVIVHSLYGETRKPTKEMLENIDTLVYDIQDIGTRFYTYIYTMAYCMMAAKENNLEFVVLDRPNPIDAINYEGNILDLKYRSFIGYYPIIQRYGLTCGETAKLFNEEYQINCDLKIVLMQDYDRSKDLEELGMNFVMPSPNIPTLNSSYLYAATCIFEGTNLSEGRGTTKPFEIIGAPYVDGDQLVRELGKYSFEGIQYKSIYFTPMFSKNEKKLCQGLELFLTDKKKFKPIAFGFTLLYIIQELYPDQFDIVKFSERPMLALNVGQDYFIKKEKTLNELLDIVKRDTIEFGRVRLKYLLY